MAADPSLKTRDPPKEEKDFQKTIVNLSKYGLSIYYPMFEEPLEGIPVSFLENENLACLESSMPTGGYFVPLESEKLGVGYAFIRAGSTSGSIVAPAVQFITSRTEFLVGTDAKLDNEIGTRMIAKHIFMACPTLLFTYVFMQHRCPDFVVEFRISDGKRGIRIAFGIAAKKSDVEFGRKKTKEEKKTIVENQGNPNGYFVKDLSNGSFTWFDPKLDAFTKPYESVLVYKQDESALVPLYAKKFKQVMLETIKEPKEFEFLCYILNI
jgi:hypothetical protein